MLLRIKAMTFMRFENGGEKRERNLSFPEEKELFALAYKTKKDTKPAHMVSVSLVKSRKTKDWRYALTNSMSLSSLSLQSLV
jgi:dTDP-D-glucose 4,6-dehydratase